MKRTYIRNVLLLLVIAVFGLAACSSAETTPQQAENEPGTPEADVAAEASPIAALPTASSPTVTSTKGPSTATPTRVLQSSAAPTLVPVTPFSEATTPAPQIYIVEEYDTLLGIAVEFDTTVEAILVANGINENDFLQIGQELIVPAPGPEVAVNTETVNQTETSADTSGTEGVTTNIDTAAADVDTQTANTGAETTAEVETVLDTASTSAPSVPVVSPLDVPRAANINPLTGLPVDDPTTLQRRPLLVRIGNDAGVRTSQAGLNSADVIYEEITEWWVTRFTAIFLSETPQTVAPIRSARLINVQLVPQYQGALAHSGGSDPVRWEISQAPIVNLDEYYNPLPYYYRPNEGWQTRLAIDIDAAREYLESQGIESPVSLHGFLFSDTLTTGQDVENIFIPYPRSTTFTQWRYVPSSGNYLRFAADSPLTDANGLGQVSADNVIVYFAEHQDTDIVEDSNGATSIRVIVNGTGTAWFFRDGKLNKGYWQTDGSRTPYFMYEDGSPYYLKPGNTWIQVVPTYFNIGLNDPGAASSRP